MTANALRDWCRFTHAGSAYIEPGSPWQNPYAESFGSGIRDELLAVELFSCLAEAKVLIEDWLIDYNELRPHPALQMMTPVAFAAFLRQPSLAPQQLRLGKRSSSAGSFPSRAATHSRPHSKLGNDRVLLRKSP